MDVEFKALTAGEADGAGWVAVVAVIGTGCGESDEKNEKDGLAHVSNHLYVFFFLISIKHPTI